MSQRLHIKSAPADHQGRLSSIVNVSYGIQCEFLVFRHAHFFRHRHGPDEMMRNFAQQTRIRFTGEDVKPAVNLERVRIYNFSANRSGDISSQLGFAAGGRAYDIERIHWLKLTEVQLGGMIGSRWRTPRCKIAE